MKVSIIIPTWNSMPEFETCLKWIKRSIPSKFISEIIVVDRYSTDGTVETAQKYGCEVLYDDVSLGSARMIGIEEAKSGTILFIDSDIQISPAWFKEMYLWWNFSPFSTNLGMLYGRTVDADKKLAKLKLWKMNRDFALCDVRLVKKGKRAFTHNTFVKKKYLEGLDISNYNAWEDYAITQHILKKGGIVAEVPVICRHWHKTKEKFGILKSGWGASGMFRVAGINAYTLGYFMWHLTEGIRATFHFRDMYYLKWGIINWMEGIKGIVKSEWGREV